MPRDKLEENIQYIVYVKVRTIGPERERERELHSKLGLEESKNNSISFLS